MKTAKIVKSRKDCSRGVRLRDGRVIVVQEGENLLMRYDEPFELDGKVTTLNDIILNKEGKDVYPYKSYSVNLKFPEDLTIDDVRNIKNKFAKKNFHVTEHAILHNFFAWKEDYKSGYRDEENGYHLFTPCGCNPLSFTATTLTYGEEYWQETYEG